MAYISWMERDRTNFQWTICLVEILLSKGVKHISEVIMTLAKNEISYLAESKISKVIEVFVNCASSASLYSSVKSNIKCL